MKAREIEPENPDPAKMDIAAARLEITRLRRQIQLANEAVDHASRIIRGTMGGPDTLGIAAQMFADGFKYCRELMRSHVERAEREMCESCSKEPA